MIILFISRNSLFTKLLVIFFEKFNLRKNALLYFDLLYKKLTEIAFFVFYHFIIYTVMTWFTYPGVNLAYFL